MPGARIGSIDRLDNDRLGSWPDVYAASDLGIAATLWIAMQLCRLRGPEIIYSVRGALIAAFGN